MDFSEFDSRYSKACLPRIIPGTLVYIFVLENEISDLL